MAAVETVAWVEPPEPIRGLDHLGVQAPCIALYGQLLPGITNVTDRARYYSFHPWVLWSFERRYTDHSVDEFRRVLRRAECLFALVAIRHARVVGDNDDGLHGRAMVGRDKLLRIEEDCTFVLEDYATLEGPNRYFKNKLGGLGQYYFGPLRDLRVLDHHQGAGYPGYDDDRGRKLAEAFASAVPEDAFFRVLEQPTTTWEDLDELVAFCPCGLPANTAEHELLLDLFLARTEPFQGDGGTTRRASLGLILDLSSQTACDVDYAFEGLLRGGAYTGALVDGSAWNVAKPLERVLRGWGTYQRNELLSLAVQGLFAAVLRAIERDEAQSIRQASDAAEIAVRLLSSRGADLELPLDALVARVRGELPALADWQHEDHELQRGWRLQNLPLNDDTKLEAIAQESIAILLALLARGVDEYPYGDFELDPEYFDPREVHLLSLRHASKTEWAGLTVEAWVRWLAVQWGVARHLRVALRKLRGERRDTFRIRPLEGELRVVEAPAPVFTQPRVSRAQQILRDLGLVEYDDEGVMILTDRGRTELEACRAG
ncbi:hypothetical protein [Hyalangium sp.]|uniref:hypothetical protein n=1 Tax=Hyalangium sp. TaxID=2028555 RepID=UPI002D432EB1|nr:hypothetical protein [Hyalangium sp.]HYH96728.1 hypothetical protein [Hyalangium sp.]